PQHQFLRQRQHLAGHLPNRFLKPLSLKPWLTTPSAVTTTGRRTSVGCSRSSSFHSASDCGDLRTGGRLRQVGEDLLTMASQPPSCVFHSTSVSGDGRSSR